MQIVAPERDTPGTSARVCASPTSSASAERESTRAARVASRPAAYRSIIAIAMPTAISAAAIT